LFCENEFEAQDSIQENGVDCIGPAMSDRNGAIFVSSRQIGS
jgi:hypothetical protein